MKSTKILLLALVAVSVASIGISVNAQSFDETGNSQSANNQAANPPAPNNAGGVPAGLDDIVAELELLNHNLGIVNSNIEITNTKLSAIEESQKSQTADTHQTIEILSSLNQQELTDGLIMEQVEISQEQMIEILKQFIPYYDMDDPTTRYYVVDASPDKGKTMCAYYDALTDVSMIGKRECPPEYAGMTVDEVNALLGRP